jgi:UTP--glucose-1-phosphate uridylyltransferase
MIDKVVIPIAGLGTRMGPLARVAPKALLPLVDRDGRVRTVLDLLIIEALEAGCQQVCLVVHPGHRELVRDYLSAAQVGAAHLELVDAAPRGFGFAVAQARPFTRDEPFVLLLGDHLRQGGGPSAVAALTAAHQRLGSAATVAVHEVDSQQLASVGVARGVPLEGASGGAQDLYRCAAFVEKPTAQEARRRLATPGLPEGRFLAHAGLYVFGPQLWPCLDEATRRTPPGREIELAAAQALLLERQPRDYYLVRIGARVFDTGRPAGYLAALRAWAPPEEP